MGILMPLAIPLAFAIGQNYGLDGANLHSYMILNISGVLTGAIFGDHCSPGYQIQASYHQWGQLSLDSSHLNATSLRA